MTPEDSAYRVRLRTLALAEELGSVRAACRAMGIHHSTYYCWKRRAEQYGLELRRPRERRRVTAFGPQGLPPAERLRPPGLDLHPHRVGVGGGSLREQQRLKLRPRIVPLHRPHHHRLQGVARIHRG